MSFDKNEDDKRIKINIDMIDGLADSLVVIPAGDFLYGRKKESRFLPEYSIMKYPVTVAQYRRYCELSNRTMPKEPHWGWQVSYPIVNVSWYDAVEFADFVGLVLPTDEEWEKAARGTDGRIFPWGDEWDELKCCNYSLQPTNIGSFPTGISPYGIHDLAGNVWEWCDSSFIEKFNPGEEMKVRRGGEYGNESPDFYRTFWKFGENPEHGWGNCGFRCVKR